MPINITIKRCNKVIERLYSLNRGILSVIKVGLGKNRKQHPTIIIKTDITGPSVGPRNIKKSPHLMSSNVPVVCDVPEPTTVGLARRLPLH